jgi:hypothetical protein
MPLLVKEPTMKKLVPMIVLLVVGCSGPSLDVMPRYGQFNVDGDFGATAGAVVLTNTADEVGIDDDDGYVGARVDFKWGLPHLIISAQTTDHSGDGVLANDIDIDGTTITAGTAVTTDFDLGLYNALLLFDILPTDNFEFGIGFGLSAIDLDAEFSGGGSSISTNEILPVPVVALSGGAQFRRLEVSALLSGMDVSIDDNDLGYIDFDAFARLGLLRPDDRGRVSLVLGYRHLDIDLEYEDGSDNVVFDMTFDGPYAGLEVSF